MSQTKKGGARLVLSIVQTALLILAAVAVFFAVTFAISYLSIEELPEGSEIGAQIGTGLSRGFSAVFFIIAAVCTAILSVPGEAVAILIAVRSRGWGRTYSICAAVAHAVFLLTCAVFWILIV